MSVCLSADRNDQNQTSESVQQSSCRGHSLAVRLDILNFGYWNLFVIWVLSFGAYPPERLCRPLVPVRTGAG